MKKIVFLLFFALLATALLSAQATKPVIVVKPFTTSPNVSLPYDMKQMQTQMLAELKAKLGTRYEIVSEAPAEASNVYVLEGEFTGWRAGNRAKRFLVGMGSGREAADVHYWVSNAKKDKVCEHKDTVRAEFWGNAYAASVGELAHPLADKVAKRLGESKMIN